MIFVWAVKHSHNEDEELRYSIRSVLKFHPDARIFVVGDLPKWYRGEHIHTIKKQGRYHDKWNKLEIAMGAFDEFIQMDDDFYLLKPFKVAHYYYGTIKEKAIPCKNSSTERSKLIWNSYKMFPDENNYMLHIPLPVCSKRFKPTDRFVSFRQYYCSLESKYERIEHPDVKLRGKKEEIPNAPFFSSSENIIYLLDKLKELYPNPSHCENDR